MFKGNLILKAAVIFILCLIIFLVIAGQSGRRLSDFQVKTYKEDIGWGYDIYANDVLLIHQPIIPGLSGNQGFVSETDAQKAAKLVTDKLKKNIMPPALTLEELRAVGIEQ